MSFNPIKYVVSPGQLVVEDCDADGNCIGRTVYTPERFAQERHELPTSVVAAYESGAVKKAEAHAPGDLLTASNDHAPAATKAAKKATTKATTKAAKKATTKR